MALLKWLAPQPRWQKGKTTTTMKKKKRNSTQPKFYKMSVEAARYLSRIPVRYH